MDKRRINYINISFSALNCTQPPVQITTGLQKKLLQKLRAHHNHTFAHSHPPYYYGSGS